MRIRIAHETDYAYDKAPRAVLQVLRLTPRDHEGQRVRRWRVEVGGEGRLRRGEDALGNVVHTFSLAHPSARVTVRVEGEADTFDTAGVLRGAVERFPPEVFLRDTPLTEADASLRAFAAEVAASAGCERLAQLHALMAAVKARLVFETGRTHADTTAADAFALGHGVCQDLTHVFLACARRMGAPARYVSGHLVRSDGQVEQEAAHAWAEAWVEGLGWLGFDPANGVCPTPAHLRVATGLDYLGAAPVRGSRLGGAGERMDVRLRVSDGARQVQS